MKKVTLLAALTLSVSIFLFGCGDKKEDPAIEEVTLETQEYTPVNEDTEPEVVEETVVEDVPPEEGMVRSRLTNEWVSADVGSLRPLAVMIPNDKSALPQYNLSNADIVYECLVEGEITRLMAIYGDWTNLERVGNVRSCRDYFVYWAFEWDAIYCHAGGPFYIDEVIGRSDTQNINALVAPQGVFYRTSDRSAPQNLYLDGQDIVKEASRLGYDLSPRNGYSDNVHFQFATKAKPNNMEEYGSSAVTATKIDLAAAYPVTQTWFEYNAEDGLYYRYQAPSGGAHMDAATESQLAFENVLIQFTYHEQRDENGYLAFQCIDTSKDGWLFTNGKGIHVNWKKTSDYGATRYYDDNGKEVQLNTGKTMICIVQDGDTFSYSN
ncbi:MAG: DUF3048 domain-containing protein [Lachnospiraceae bacterium]|nr:DUF3048 domain-containing protein [Lachnospiraceae bacterium]